VKIIVGCEGERTVINKCLELLCQCRGFTSEIYGNLNKYASQFLLATSRSIVDKCNHRMKSANNCVTYFLYRIKICLTPLSSSKLGHKTEFIPKVMLRSSSALVSEEAETDIKWKLRAKSPNVQF